MKLHHCTGLFVFIVSMGSAISHASCMDFQGVTLCDNGDRQTVIGNNRYTNRDGEMTISQEPDYDSDYYIYDYLNYGYCYNTKRRCFSRWRYQGDIAGQ